MIPRTPSHRAHGSHGRGLVGEERNDKADQTVGAGLEQQRREDQTAGGGRLGVGVGQPVVDRNRGQLDGEGDKEAEHDPEGRGRVHGCAQELGVVEGVDPGFSRHG